MNEAKEAQSERLEQKPVSGQTPEYLAGHALWQAEVDELAATNDLLAAVSAAISYMKSEKVLSDISERESDFETALKEFDAGIVSADDVRRAAARYAALVLATAQRRIAQK